MHRCTRLGDAAYDQLAKRCPNIEELRLYASMPSAKAIQGFSALTKLRVIDICGAHSATGDEVFARLHHNKILCLHLGGSRSRDTHCHTCDESCTGTAQQ